MVITIAWYWHIKPSNYSFPLWQIILISWGNCSV
ncbi:DMT family protein [Snodgrassella communis]|nr:DMT family protein [Snodgrassella communis]